MESLNPVWILVVLGVGAILFKAIVWYADVNSDRDKFKEFMNEIKSDLKGIRENLAQLNLYFPPTVTVEKSPLQLTELGASLYECLDAKTLIDEQAKGMKDQVAKMNRYQVQEHCENFFMAEYKPDDETLSKWQDCAYEKGLKMRHVHLVLSVELRNKILSLRGHPRL